MASPITLALDWTLNTNHSGFVVAKAKNYYTDEGLDVSFISPGSDYKPPADLVRTGSATFGITPSETVISSLTRSPQLKVKCPLLLQNILRRLVIFCEVHDGGLMYTQGALDAQAIATLLEEDTSAIVTLKSSGIDAPSKLDGKIYASYAARWVQHPLLRSLPWA